MKESSRKSGTQSTSRMNVDLSQRQDIEFRHTCRIANWDVILYKKCPNCIYKVQVAAVKTVTEAEVVQIIGKD